MAAKDSVSQISNLLLHCGLLQNDQSILSPPHRKHTPTRAKAFRGATNMFLEGGRCGTVPANEACRLAGRQTVDSIDRAVFPLNSSRTAESQRSSIQDSRVPNRALCVCVSHVLAKSLQRGPGQLKLNLIPAGWVPSTSAASALIDAFATECYDTIYVKWKPVWRGPSDLLKREHLLPFQAAIGQRFSRLSTARPICAQALATSGPQSALRKNVGFL